MAPDCLKDEAGEGEVRAMQGPYLRNAALIGSSEAALQSRREAQQPLVLSQELQGPFVQVGKNPTGTRAHLTEKGMYCK